MARPGRVVESRSLVLIKQRMLRTPLYESLYYIVETAISGLHQGLRAHHATTRESLHPRATLARDAGVPRGGARGRACVSAAYRPPFGVSPGHDSISVQ